MFRRIPYSPTGSTGAGGTAIVMRLDGRARPPWRERLILLGLVSDVILRNLR